MAIIRKILPWLSAIFGGILMASGIFFVAMYIVEAIIKRSGDPDQSLLFWYLPLLFIGFFTIAFGLFLLILGVRKLRGK